MQIVNWVRVFASALCSVLASICVGITALFYVAEIVARYGLSSPLNWASDIGSYLLCATVFLMLPQIALVRGHIAVSIVLDLLPENARQIYGRILEFATASALLVVGWFVVRICLQQFDQGVLTPMANQIPRWWLTAIMGLGLVLSAINFVLPAVKSAAAHTVEV